MKKWRWMGSVTVVLLLAAMSLSACSSNGNSKPNAENGAGAPTASEGNAEKQKEIVELKALFPGDTPQGFDEVMAAVNEKLKKDNIGASLKIQFIPWSDYGNTTSVKIAANEQFDMFLEAPWLHMGQMIASGSIYALDEFVEGREELKQSIPEMMWEANKFNGKIMGIPLGTTQTMVYGFQVRKDLREKYGLPEIKTLDDMVNFLYAVKENDKDLIPFVVDQRTAGHNAQRFNSLYYTNDYDGFAVTNEFLATSDKKVIPIYERLGYENGYKYSEQFYKDGIFHKNIMQEQNAATLFNQGKAASYPYYSDGVVNYTDLLKNVPGAELEIVVPAVDGWKPLSDFKQWNFLSVPKYSKNVELVMDVMNWLSIKENHDLLEYGIQGKDWNPVGESGYESISDYSFPGYVMTWRPQLARTPSTMIADDKKWVDFSKDANNFSPAVTTGFTANLDAVKTEIAQITPLNEQILSPMAAGLHKFEDGIAKYKSEMERAGSQKVIEELQKQLDAFLAGK
ncbi:hypothetical protein B1748_24670 [Paenibacillus sp. MY03]|uniref:ABC transporter substrate-binding protein n=1 Tax=Paenibacillus sp. MY03 TaxID=302980 RepID=UPI000B3CE414|nr:DUF3502 domain-containing protein [Paenibacillus sp. MY03]OUS72421.1 hypothetical protein B1748_24670 [Paenibacillus sp. MY03]